MEGYVQDFMELFVDGESDPSPLPSLWPPGRRVDDSQLVQLYEVQFPP
jgi:hypothetical protein